MITPSLTMTHTSLLTFLDMNYVAWGFYMHEENGEESQRVRLMSTPNEYFYRDEDKDDMPCYCLGFIPQDFITLSIHTHN